MKTGINSKLLSDVHNTMVMSFILCGAWLPVCVRRARAPSRRFLATAQRLCARPSSVSQDMFGITKPSIISPTANRKIVKPEPHRPISCGAPPCLREELLCKVADQVRDSADKVTVVGSGMVGIACATAILFQKISGHVALVDAFPKKLEGEAMDFHHGSIFMGDPRVDFDTDFCVSSNSKVVVIAAGARQKKGETRLDLVQRNADIFKNIIPPLVEYSPKAVFIIVANPVDIMTWITWKISGLPVNKVIGSGTQLDSARFRYMIAERLGLAPSSVEAWIIGEHGDSQVPLWSGVNVAGVQFRDIVPNIGLETDEEKWYEVAKDVVKAGPLVRCLKGYTNTAVGLSVADLTDCVLRNLETVKAVSTLVQGHHEICHEIFLSLPCTIGENGVTQVIRMRMTEYEKKLLTVSADTVYEVQKGVKT